MTTHCTPVLSDEALIEGQIKGSELAPPHRSFQQELHKRGASDTAIWDYSELESILMRVSGIYQDLEGNSGSALRDESRHLLYVVSVCRRIMQSCTRDVHSLASARALLVKHSIYENLTAIGLNALRFYILSLRLLCIFFKPPQTQRLIVKADANDTLASSSATGLKISPVVHTPVFLKPRQNLELPRPITIPALAEAHNATSGVHAAREHHKAESHVRLRHQ
jgi:hypothetical protein